MVFTDEGSLQRATTRRTHERQDEVPQSWRKRKAISNRTLGVRRGAIVKFIVGSEECGQNPPVGGIGKLENVVRVEFFVFDLAPVAIHLALALSDLNHEPPRGERGIAIDEISQLPFCPSPGAETLRVRLHSCPEPLERLFPTRRQYTSRALARAPSFFGERTRPDATQMRRGKLAQPFQEPALLGGEQGGPDMLTRNELSIVERTRTRHVDDMLFR